MASYSSATSTSSASGVAQARLTLARLIPVAGAAIVLFLAFYNLVNFPLTWFDEGSHLHVPKTLVRYGVYADYSHDGFRYFGPTMGVGPTVLLPIAAVFKLFGIGLLQARVVMALYLIAAIGVFFGFTWWFGGWRFAWAATALLVSTRGIALLEYGRQVLGEVPGLFFTIAGFWLWFSSWRGGDRSWATTLLAGLLFGAAMITKTQYFIVLAPTLLVAWAANFYYRSAPQRVFLVPGIIAGLCFAGWQVALVFVLGPTSDLQANLLWYREATAGAALVFSPDLMRRALGELLSPKTFLGLLLPALVYGLTLPRMRDRLGHQWAVLLALVTVNLVWYVTASIGWLRYAFPALAVGCLFVARALHDLTHGFHFEWPAIRRSLEGSRLNKELLDVRAPRWRPVWGLVLIALIVPPLSRTVAQIVWPPFNAPLAIAEYMNYHIPKDELVATWEQEMGFLTDHRYAYPPQAMLPKAVSQVWSGGAPVSDFYDFEREGASYVLVGPLAEWVGIYPAEILNANYQLVTTIGGYRLYQVKP